MLKRLIDGHNRLSDLDLIWFPFIFLKPKMAQVISFPRTLVMAVCFGTYFWVALIIRRKFFNESLGEDVLQLLFYCCIGFLIWFNLVTRPFWNVRARRRGLR
jgi:hypothetical protein